MIFFTLLAYCMYISLLYFRHGQNLYKIQGSNFYVLVNLKEIFILFTQKTPSIQTQMVVGRKKANYPGKTDFLFKIMSPKWSLHNMCYNLFGISQLWC